MRAIVSGLLLALGFIASSSLYAQTSHLNVPPRQMVTIQANVDAGVTPATQSWGEYLFGVKTGGVGPTFVVPTGKTLVITDFDFTISNNLPATTVNVPPIFNVVILDPAGVAIHYPGRIQPALRSAGREQVRISLTSGIAVPSSFQVAVENMQLGNYMVTRGAINGYYVH
ncbi:MAG: hypothetical protein H7Y02_01845 [Candidatus Obscuribacterales bacterium]|nr:hypothetical protein [Steroidobacteraceae bacterium]